MVPGSKKPFPAHDYQKVNSSCTTFYLWEILLNGRGKYMKAETKWHDIKLPVIGIQMTGHFV